MGTAVPQLQSTMQPSAALSACVLVVLGSSFVRSQNDTLRQLSKTLHSCRDEPDLYSCLKIKAVRMLDHALKQDSLPITDFLTLSRDPSSEDSSPVGVELRDGVLPQDSGEQATALDRMLADRLSRYFRTRTLRLNVPEDIFEGRGKGYKGGKGDKGGGMMLVVVAYAAMYMKMALGKLALIAGKALLVSKVALLLAGIVGLKSLIASGQSENQSHKVIYASLEPEKHASWGRSLGSGGILAYRGQKQNAATNQL